MWSISWNIAKYEYEREIIQTRVITIRLIDMNHFTVIHALALDNNKTNSFFFLNFCLLEWWAIGKEKYWRNLRIIIRKIIFHSWKYLGEAYYWYFSTKIKPSDLKLLLHCFVIRRWNVNLHTSRNNRCVLSTVSLSGYHSSFNWGNLEISKHLGKEV